ncbi:hypothetical protein [Hyalangium rubrum]|uniref:Pilus assembly protein n=1 Tax=Hyalangium rubrum TaxID=3103134 RepID=A0ABU5HE23_9BACT|nr:hypothetical protein [Hyalangium sp. s54d21]MDY7231042.1 hypothetical protein [Hyalangium sp. s54d21]
MSLPMPKRQRRSSGQSLTEVIIIIFLVGIGAIGIVTLFGDNIKGLFGASSESLIGAPNVENPGTAANNVNWNMKGGTVSPYAEGGCGATGSCSVGYNP